MIAIMLVTTVILPKMMEGMGDPQEMLREAQAAQEQQGQSSGQQSVQGGGGSGGGSSGKGRNKRK